MCKYIKLKKILSSIKIKSKIVRKWLYKLEFKYKDIKKVIFAYKYKRLDIIEEYKKFWNIINDLTSYLIKFKKDKLIKK